MDPTMQLVLRPCRGTLLLRLHLRRLTFFALDAKGGERVVRGLLFSFDILVCVLLHHASCLILCIALV